MSKERSAKFDSVTDMEPLFPSDSVDLQDLAALVWRSAAEIRGLLPEKTRVAVAEVVLSMNGYYSNLIEGHHTRPADIEAALKKQFSENSVERNRQLLHLAHLETLGEAERSLTTTTKICSKEYLSELHRAFFSKLPRDLLVTKDEKGREFETIPGELRRESVAVGQHLAPPPQHLDTFLKRFEEAYAPTVEDRPSSLIAASAAHHRLVWIHPFGDGNGRVSRMFTHLWFKQAGAGGNGLWTLSRGLARKEASYKSLLNKADEKRLHDFDGRGYLSQSALGDFCKFTLDTAHDQISFMKEMLSLGSLKDRLRGFCEVKERSGELPKRTSILLPEIVLKGEIPRGEVSRIIVSSPRTAQPLVAELLHRGYLKSDSPKGSLSIGFPTEACSFVFPDLFPAGYQA